jgi:hypothetical protein
VGEAIGEFLFFILFFIFFVVVAVGGVGGVDVVCPRSHWPFLYLSKKW